MTVNIIFRRLLFTHRILVSRTRIESCLILSLLHCQMLFRSRKKLPCVGEVGENHQMIKIGTPSTWKCANFLWKTSQCLAQLRRQLKFQGRDLNVTFPEPKNWLSSEQEKLDFHKLGGGGHKSVVIQTNVFHHAIFL